MFKAVIPSKRYELWLTPDESGDWYVLKEMFPEGHPDFPWRNIANGTYKACRTLVENLESKALVIHSVPTPPWKW